MLGATVLLAFQVHAGDPGGTDPGAGDVTATADQIRIRLEQLEADAGAYSPQLAEPLGEMGLVLLNSGAPGDARKYFRQAMQIQRVQTGLYTPSQLPLLDLVIESSVAARDWEQVGEDFEYFEWLSYRIHGPGNPALIDALGRIIDWHLAAIHLDAEDEKAGHLLQLLELGKRRVMLTEQHLGTGHPQHLEQLYQLAMHHYYVYIAAQRPGPVSDALVTTLTSPVVHGRSFLLAQEQIADDCYRNGRRLLERAIEAAGTTPGFSAQSAAMGKVYLADWELMFNHEGRASRAYAGAFAALADAGVPPEMLQRFFGTPVMLPEPEFRLALGAIAESQDVPVAYFIPWAREIPGVRFPAPNAGFLTTPTDRYALTRFHVEENGWAENIRIVEVHPDDRALSRDARNAMWYVQFRPRIEDGRLVATRDREARYLPTE